MNNILYSAYYYNGDDHDVLYLVAPKNTKMTELIKLFKKHYKENLGNTFDKGYIYSIDIFPVESAYDLKHEYKIKLERIK